MYIYIYIYIYFIDPRSSAWNDKARNVMSSPGGPGAAHAVRGKGREREREIEMLS